eukprot:5663833-Alexandrium_andersonii.AAC.1
MPAMPYVGGHPPAEPNLFCDASVDPPSQPSRSMVGLGVWAPRGEGEMCTLDPGILEFVLEGD